jgi:hypothetical protein
MSDINFDIDVHDADIADQIERRIEDGIEEAVSPRRPDSLGQKMKAAARNHIRAHGRIWTTELINSFDIKTETSNGSAVLILQNDAGHAAAIDVGAEYGDEGPPLHKLIPWVQAKLKGYRVRGGALVKYEGDPGGSTILTDGSGEVPGVTESLPTDLDVKEVRDLEESGIEGGSNRGRSYRVEFENGEEAYFEEYQDKATRGGSEFGSARNELVFTRVSAEEDWELAPENKAGNIVDPDSDDVLRGNFQRWIDGENAEELIEGEFTPADYDMEYTPTEFVNQNREWMAKITAIDILIGNADRHGKNIRIDADGRPHGIDNGGHYFPFGDTLDGLISYNSVPTAMNELKQFDAYPNLEDAMSAMFAEQTDYLRILLEDHSEDILQHVRLVHGKNSDLYRRMEKLLTFHTDEIIDKVQERQQQFLDTHSHSTDDIDKALEEADDVDIEDLGDEVDDLLEDI